MLHKLKTHRLLGLMLFCPLFTVIAQFPVNGFYAEKQTLTIAPSYSYKSFDQFYRGTELSEGNPAGLGDISSYIFSLYASYTINDWLSAVVTLPYITTQSQDGVLDPVQQTDRVDGIQDLGIFAKAKILEKSFKNNAKVTLGGAAGITFPASDYDGAGVLSLGNEATTINGAAIVNYVSPYQIFAEAQVGYSNRDSKDFDIPNAMLYGFKLGYFNQFFYIHANLEIQDSMSGLDIGTPEFADAGGPNILPETEVDFTNLSFNLYIPVYQNKLGVFTGYTSTLDGRNFSKESALSFGLVYSSL
ncbi:hypothetical protein [Aquimarina sp. SS2-1]|uniref:hypothetical protein n=1 Tax=Aquimarina besae TaxID=3342247 RepID=UPI00366E7803